MNQLVIEIHALQNSAEKLSFANQKMEGDLKRARRLTIRIYALGQKIGSPIAGELAQLLLGNVFHQTDMAMNIINMCLETSEHTLSTVPLNKAIRLFMDARSELPQPFVSRSDCLQTSVLDILLCYISFWGQLFEYYETMYYKPIPTRDGESPIKVEATVSFEVGWSITCLFIRDTMLGRTAKAAGVDDGYNRSMSWFFYPANASEELETAKELLLTVISQIRKRGTPLVSGEGLIGKCCFSNVQALQNFVEDNLDRDWNNVEKLQVLTQHAFESSTIRLNVSVNPIVHDDSSPINTSFGSSLETSFLDGMDDSPSYGALAMSSRSISLNVRPMTPVILASPCCEWSGIDMVEFCKEISEICQWPEVVNTVSTAGEIGISVINMKGDVVVNNVSERPWRMSSSSSRRCSLTSPEKVISSDSLLPFPTPQGMPPLELLLKSSPGFGFLPIPELTPTPSSKQVGGPLEDTPQLKRNSRESDVTFFGGTSPDVAGAISPLIQASGVLVALPSDADFDFSTPTIVNAVPPVATRPSEVERPVTRESAELGLFIRCMSSQRGDVPNGREWNLERAIGSELLSSASTSLIRLNELVRRGEAVEPTTENTDDGNKRQRRGRRSSSDRRSSSSGKNKPQILPVRSEDELKAIDVSLKLYIEVALRRSLRELDIKERKLVYGISRILSLATILTSSIISESKIKGIVSIAADFVCFCSGVSAVIPATDVYASGLRGTYVDSGIAMFEVGKDLALTDWFSLSVYYNDEAFSVLMGQDGLLQPRAPSSSSARQGGVSQKLVPLSNAWESLPQHCLLVCSELMMRWAWTSSSGLWRVYEKLAVDYLARRHGADPAVILDGGKEQDILELDYFVKQCLVNAGMYLIDLADRIGTVPPIVLHAAFDLVRSTILLRPKLIQNRHLYQVVYCSLMAASEVFTPNSGVVDFSRIGQAAVVMQPNPDAQKVTLKYILKSVPLTSNGGSDLFSDCSGALVLPDPTDSGGVPPPEFQQAGDVAEFYQEVFVPEMRQVVFNLRKMTLRRSPERPMGDMGPFVQNANPHESISPCSFVAISSATALAMQLLSGQSGVQFKAVPYRQFERALPLVSPMGALPSLLPPVKPLDGGSARGERVYRWVRDAAIRAKGGAYEVVYN